MSEFESYWREIDLLLTRVDEANLDEIERDELATGIGLERRHVKTFAEAAKRLGVRHPHTFEFGERILRLLSDADDALDPEQVEKLDALVAERLPPTI